MKPPHRYHDLAYLALLRQILFHGRSKGDRTGTGTLSLFGERLVFDLRHSFPLLTTKKLPLRWIAEELFWFLRGSTDEKELREAGVDIWKEWATKEQCARFGRAEGDLGPVYGHQWRRFGATPGTRTHIMGSPGVSRLSYRDDGFDQIANALDLLQNSPDSRRIIVSGWNPREANTVALPPCHTLFQFETHEEDSPHPSPYGHTPDHERRYRRVLSCHMYQRSADVFLGVPFNIASYALLTEMIAMVLGYRAGDLVVSFGDVHIYKNHVEQVKEQLSRMPAPSPQLYVGGTPENCSPLEALMSIRWENIGLHGYTPHPKITAPVAV